MNETIERKREAAVAAPCSAFLRVIVETHDSRLEMDTRCGTAQYIEARAIEAIRAGCVELLIAAPNAKLTRPTKTQPTPE